MVLAIIDLNWVMDYACDLLSLFHFNLLRAVLASSGAVTQSFTLLKQQQQKKLGYCLIRRTVALAVLGNCSNKTRHAIPKL